MFDVEVRCAYNDIWLAPAEVAIAANNHAIIGRDFCIHEIKGLPISQRASQAPHDHNLTSPTF